MCFEPFDLILMLFVGGAFGFMFGMMFRKAR